MADRFCFVKLATGMASRGAAETDTDAPSTASSPPSPLLFSAPNSAEGGRTPRTDEEAAPPAPGGDKAAALGDPHPDLALLDNPEELLDVAWFDKADAGVGSPDDDVCGDPSVRLSWVDGDDDDDDEATGIDRSSSTGFEATSTEDDDALDLGDSVGALSWDLGDSNDDDDNDDVAGPDTGAGHGMLDFDSWRGEGDGGMIDFPLPLPMPLAPPATATTTTASPLLPATASLGPALPTAQHKKKRQRRATHKASRASREPLPPVPSVDEMMALFHTELPKGAKLKTPWRPNEDKVRAYCEQLRVAVLAARAQGRKQPRKGQTIIEASVAVFGRNLYIRGSGLKPGMASSILQELFHFAGGSKKWTRQGVKRSAAPAAAATGRSTGSDSDGARGSSKDEGRGGGSTPSHLRGIKRPMGTLSEPSTPNHFNPAPSPVANRGGGVNGGGGGGGPPVAGTAYARGNSACGVMLVLPVVALLIVAIGSYEHYSGATPAVAKRQVIAQSPRSLDGAASVSVRTAARAEATIAGIPARLFAPEDRAAMEDGGGDEESAATAGAAATGAAATGTAVATTTASSSSTGADEQQAADELSDPVWEEGPAEVESPEQVAQEGKQEKQNQGGLPREQAQMSLQGVAPVTQRKMLRGGNSVSLDVEQQQEDEQKAEQQEVEWQQAQKEDLSTMTLAQRHPPMVLPRPDETGGATSDTQQRIEAPQCMNDCSGHGDCVVADTAAMVLPPPVVCRCAPGWDDLDCSVRLCPMDCSGNGNCVDGFCECSVGFVGLDCSVEADADDADAVEATLRTGPLAVASTSAEEEDDADEEEAPDAGLTAVPPPPLQPSGHGDRLVAATKSKWILRPHHSTKLGGGLTHLPVNNVNDI